MTAARHLIFLVEEPSMEEFLKALLPRCLGDCEFDIYPFRGKADMLKKLEKRLRAYAKGALGESRVVVLVDRDSDDCRCLKEKLECMARRAGAGLRSRTRAGARCWNIVNRIVIEELEAWYFGNWLAVQRAYPRVPDNIPRRTKYRYPDAVTGGTWEAFERELQQSGYFPTGLRKTEAAREIGACIDLEENTSPSFEAFHEALREALA